mmetsp:Transcript_13713/g.14253  ORF Transcript_13713/g.14253 Transcript_13713/m.14253 type:complete len:522 (+) Transcript_13713:12-1577(+)
MKGFLSKVQRRVSGSSSSSTSSTSNTSNTSNTIENNNNKNSSSSTTTTTTSSSIISSSKLTPTPPIPSNSNNGIETTPKADVTLPKKEKRRTSFNRSQKMQVLKDLALLSDTPTQKREALFKQKLQLCGVIFNFDDAESDVRGKELKRETLLELAEYVNSPVGQKIFTESIMPDIVEMVRLNLFRTLAPQTDDFDPEEDEPAMEPAWPHLQVVYEFFLRFVVSAEVNGKVAKRYVDQQFLRNWIELFDAEDPRERDYVKTILHRMYGKFMSYRSFIRKAISQVFYRYIYETGKHNGIGELLEILGSIINGFAIPLKAEHLQFLEKCLLPLHKPNKLNLYHPQLSYCITQYVSKDPQTLVVIIDGLIKFWPWHHPSKQILFLNELEEILELCKNENLVLIQDKFYQLLNLCLASEHFQVVERTLYFWNSEHLCSTLLVQSKASIILPVIVRSLTRTAQGHWNQTVESLAQTVLKMYMEIDVNLYDRCSREAFEEEKQLKTQRNNSKQMWESLRQSSQLKVDS